MGNGLGDLFTLNFIKNSDRSRGDIRILNIPEIKPQLIPAEQIKLTGVNIPEENARSVRLEKQNTN